MADGVEEGPPALTSLPGPTWRVVNDHPECDSIRVRLDIILNIINTNSSLSLTMHQALC